MILSDKLQHSATERTYSGKVDIWSLGCVVLEMWSGKRPWGEMEQVAAMFEVSPRCFPYLQRNTDEMQLFNKRARPPLPPDIHLSPLALDFMNDRCLAKDPRDRPVAVDLLNHPFILEVDSRWTFKTSTIGKAVAKRGVKGIKQA
jgi:mitogen-activated protein kinase kinase kinase